jgi:hypothetical protein
MNERIQQLAEQAYEQKPLMVVNPQTYEPEHKIGNGGVPMYHRVFNQEKFAELIVRECMKICQNHPSIIFKNEWDADVVSTDIVSRLESHFGVEE